MPGHIPALLLSAMKQIVCRSEFISVGLMLEAVTIVGLHKCNKYGNCNHWKNKGEIVLQGREGQIHK